MSYLYTDGTNKLAGIAGEQVVGYEYDAAGNIIIKGDDGFAYSQANHLASVEKQDKIVGSYGYDGNNLRTVKIVDGKSVYSLYAMNGNLIAEYDSTGRVLNEFVYADRQRLALFAYKHVGGTGRGNEGQPVGQESRPLVKDTPPGQKNTPPGQEKKGDHLASLPNLPGKVIENVLPYYKPFIYYFISDHLGAGQMVVDSTAQVVWQADYQPFGAVDMVKNALENNFRFPGQYFDAETGLHYNWNRYYDPETGRYISADPIGLGSGLNLYLYANGNGTNFVDPRGLKWVVGELDGVDWVPDPSDPPSQPLPGYNWCGPGGNGMEPTCGLDAACKDHDQCYDECELDSEDVDLCDHGQDDGPSCQDKCDDALCDAAGIHGGWIVLGVKWLFCD